MPDHHALDFDTLLHPLEDAITTRTQPLGVDAAIARGRRRRLTRRLTVGAVVGVLSVGGVGLGTQQGVDRSVPPSGHLRPPDNTKDNTEDITAPRPVPAPKRLTPQALAVATGLDNWKAAPTLPPPAAGRWCTEPALKAALPYASAHAQVFYATPEGLAGVPPTVPARGVASLGLLQFDSRAAARRGTKAFWDAVAPDRCWGGGTDAVVYVDGTSVSITGGNTDKEANEEVWVRREPTRTWFLEIRNGMSSQPGYAQSEEQRRRVADALVAEARSR